MDTNTIIRVISFSITLLFQFLAIRKLGDKGWKAAVPVYKHYTFGKLSGHPVSGLLWGIFSIISDFFLAYLVSDVVIALYQVVKTESLSVAFSDTTFLSAIAYLVLHVLMVIVRFIVFRAYGKRFMFSKIFVLACAFVPALGYAAISLKKDKTSPEPDMQQ